MKQQTAVDWLIEQIKYIDKETYATLFNEDKFKQAKQMESIQMDSEYRKGWEAAEKSLSKEIEKIHEYYRSHRPI